MRYVILTFALALPLLAQAADAPIAGTFVYTGGEAQKQSQQKAIEEGTKGMFPIAIPIARGEISKRNQVATRLQIAVAENRVSTNEGGAPATSPADGTAIDFVSNKGEKVKLRQKLEGRSLDQSFATKRGTRQNVYVIGADDKTLTLQVNISSPQLPRVISYTLTYKRVGGMVTAAN